MQIRTLHALAMYDEKDALSLSLLCPSTKFFILPHFLARETLDLEELGSGDHNSLLINDRCVRVRM